MVASAVGNHEFDAGCARSRRPGDQRTARNAQWDYLGRQRLPRRHHDAGAAGVRALRGRRPRPSASSAPSREETPTLVSPGGVIDLVVRRPRRSGEPGRRSAHVTETRRTARPTCSSRRSTRVRRPECLTLEWNEAIEPRVRPRSSTRVSPKVDAIVTGHTHQAYAYNAPIPGQPGVDPTGPADGQLCGQRRSDPADRRPRHRSRCSAYTVVNVPTGHRPDDSVLAAPTRGVAAVSTTRHRRARPPPPPSATSPSAPFERRRDYGR